MNKQPQSYTPSSRRQYGEAAIAPADPILAGEVGSWRLHITVGKHGIDDGGALVIARRDISDWQIPQFDRPREPGYVTAETNGDATLRLRYDTACYVRPWRAAIVVEVYDGSLAPGDEVSIVLGDRRHGSPGMRAQTFPETLHTFKVLVDAFGTGRYYEMDESPTLRIRGGIAEALQVVAPSIVGVNEPFAAAVRAVDHWGNPSLCYTGRVSVRASGIRGLPRQVSFALQDRGVVRLEGLRASSPRRLELSATDTHGREARSNTLLVVEDDARRLYWGDLHGQTRITIGTGSVEEYLSFARDAAALDFTSWQGNDFQITEENWDTVVEQIKRFNEPGRFVTFLGYEWSGLTPAGGDHNIYFLKDDQPLHRSSHWLIEDKSDGKTDRYPISDLLTDWGEEEALAIPHVGGRHANLDFYDARYMPVVEIHSHHGTFEWLAEEALARGLKVGFIAGSDDHTGRPGLSYPTRASSRGLASFDVKGGYAAVYAEELTREAVWEAIGQRHTYATTGERILLCIETPDGAMMGDDVAGEDPPQFQVDVVGTAPLLSVELRRGLKTVYRWPDPRDVSALPRAERQLAVVWSGVRVRSRKKKTRWDGMLTIQKGAFGDVEAFAFDRSDEGVTRLSNQSIRWTSTTSGDPDGVFIDVTGEDAVLRLATEPISLELPLSEIGDHVRVFEAGGVNQRVEVFWMPKGPLPPDVSFSFQDPSPIEDYGVPYWVRVTQRDGAMAWSSPIYYQQGGDAS